MAEQMLSENSFALMYVLGFSPKFLNEIMYTMADVAILLSCDKKHRY